MLRRAPVAFLCTRMSLDLASLVSGPRAPEPAIFALFSSWVARLVIHPTALHCTSTLVDIICRIRGARPPNMTIDTLFSARNNIWSASKVCVDETKKTKEKKKEKKRHTVDSKITQSSTGSPLDLDVRALEQE